MHGNNRQKHDLKVGTYFDKAAETFDTFYDKKRNRFMQWIDIRFRSDMFERFRITFQALGSLQDKTLIDIGCGSGPYVAEAVRRGCLKVTGLDMASGMLDLAKHRVESLGIGNKCNFILGTFPENAPPDKYDCAIVMGVIDYIADPDSFLSKLASHVTSLAVLSFPSKHWFRTPFRKFRYWLKRCPVYFYDSDQIYNLLTKAGFFKVTVQKIPGAGMDYVAVGHRS